MFKQKAVHITMIEEYSEKTKMLLQLHYGRLPEKDRRQYVALESLRLGRGGVRYVCQVFGIDKKTVQFGRKELLKMSAEHLAPAHKQRRSGAGRKKNGSRI